MSTATAAATDYDKLQDARIKKLEDQTGPEPNCDLGYHWDAAEGKCVPDKPDPQKCGPNPDPNNEHVKEGGWGGDTSSPKTWKSVAMKDDPKQWKVVDSKDVNIAHKFESEAKAEEYITWHRCTEEAGGPDEPPPNPEPGGGGGSGGGANEAGPYQTVGTPMESTQRGPTTRHYASGKADDETIEKNVKGIRFSNYQWTCTVTMNKTEHDDYISVKFGGVHQGGGGWFDCGVQFGTAKEPAKGQTCLGTEPKHPSTKLCIKKGPEVGDILEKKISLAGVFFKSQNKIELWTNLGDGWKKQLEGVDVGGLKPNEPVNETQLRIDGFTKGSIPTIHYAKVSEIKV